MEINWGCIHQVNSKIVQLWCHHKLKNTSCIIYNIHSNISENGLVWPKMYSLKWKLDRSMDSAEVLFLLEWKTLRLIENMIESKILLALILLEWKYEKNQPQYRNQTIFQKHFIHTTFKQFKIINLSHFQTSSIHSFDPTIVIETHYTYIHTHKFHSFNYSTYYKNPFNYRQLYKSHLNKTSSNHIQPWTKLNILWPCYLHFKENFQKSKQWNYLKLRLKAKYLITTNFQCMIKQFKRITFFNWLHKDG